MRDLCFGFVGIGLMGGSLAKALRRVYPSSKIIVYNRTRSSAIDCVNDGTANFAAAEVDSSFGECDYIFLCTPVEKNLEFLKLLKPIINPECIITDVGSVKTNIHSTVKDLGIEHSFIGGHPMTGSEKTSYENANDRLYENAYYAITKTDKSDPEKVDEFNQIVKDIGAIPINIDYREHDRVVAAISHLPHLIASSLVNLVEDNDDEEQYMKILAAGGFKDITRIASSSPDMWEQICMSNNENISDMLGKYIISLTDIQKSLDSKSGGDIYKLIEKSRNYRDNIEDRSKSLIDKSYSLYCDIIDESGAIATIATILATSGINIKNIGIIHNREFEEGVLRIAFYDEESAGKAENQLKKHRYKIFKRV